MNESIQTAEDKVREERNDMKSDTYF